jgi:hypothetical protein
MDLGMTPLELAQGRRLLLGGWQDIADDVMNLSGELRRSAGVCACGHTTPGPAACPCCQAGMPQTTCADCGAQVATIGRRLETLVLDTVRFLPVTVSLLHARGANEELAELESLGGRIASVESTYHRLLSGAAELRPGCPASQFARLAALAQELERRVRTIAGLLQSGDPGRLTRRHSRQAR